MTLLSQLIVGLPGVLVESQARPLDYSGFVNYSDINLIVNAVDQIAKSKQAVIDAVTNCNWYNWTDNHNTLNLLGAPVSSGRVYVLRSSTSNDQMVADGNRTAARMSDRIRFAGDHYQSAFNQTSDLTIVLVGRRLRSSRSEYIYAGNVICALNTGNPRHRIGYNDGATQHLIGSTGVIPNNNPHMLSWRIGSNQASFYLDGQLINQETILPIVPQAISSASWFASSSGDRANFDGYGLFVANQPVNIDHIHCFADRFYNLGLGLG